MLAILAVPAYGQDLPATPAAAAPPVTSGRFTYRFGVDYMLQVSGRRDYPYNDQRFRDDETFAWWRLKPRLVATSQHLEIVLEGQDTHSAGSAFGARKAWLDILQAYVEFRDMGPWTASVGRRQGDLDVIPRMVRTSDFASVIRSFDVAEVAWRRRNSDVRAFVFTPVDNLPTRFNREKDGERLWTIYGSHAFGPRATLQSYVIARHNRDVTSETGEPGSGAVYAWEAQASGPTPSRLVDWTVETVIERGHYATDDVRAWGLFLRGDVDLPGRHTLDVRYSFASGDEAHGDGVRGGYDTFYAPASSFGSLGQLKGVNVRSLNVGGNIAISAPLTLSWRYFNTHLATRHDIWYASAMPNIARPNASSSFLGQETDVTLSYRVSRKLQVRTGYYRFFPGGYVADGPRRDPSELRLQIIGGL